MKYLVLLFTIGLILKCGSLHSQAQFQAVFGGNSVDHPWSIIQTFEGGYAITGWTRSFGTENTDAFICTFDSSGNMIWFKTIGGPQFDWTFSLIQASDSGYVVTGSTASFGQGIFDVYIVKLSKNGDLLWTRTIGGNDEDFGSGIVQTFDNGFVIAGGTKSFGMGDFDVYVIKINDTGKVQWTRTVGGPNEDWAFNLCATTDFGVAIVGSTKSFGAGDFDVYVVKFDSTGLVEWTTTIGGPGGDWGYSILQSVDGGYVIAGSTKSYGVGDLDIYIIKLDSSGSLIWTRTIGGIYEEESFSIIQANDGGYAIAGYTSSFGNGLQDMYIIKIDSAGNNLWGNTFGGRDYEQGISIVNTYDNGYLVAGIAYLLEFGKYMAYLVKIDSAGNSCKYQNQAGFVGSGGIMGSGGFLSSGGIEGDGGVLNTYIPDYYTICFPLGQEELTLPLHSARIKPNPFSECTFVEVEYSKFSFGRLQIFNLLGQLIFESIIENSMNVICPELPQGLYVGKVLLDDGIILDFEEMIVVM